jgi:hypothetical protein
MLVKSSRCCSSGNAKILSPRFLGAEACAAISPRSRSRLGSNSSWRAVCLRPRSAHLLGTSLLRVFNRVNAVLYISSRLLVLAFHAFQSLWPQMTANLFRPMSNRIRMRILLIAARSYEPRKLAQNNNTQPQT